MPDLADSTLVASAEAWITGSGRLLLRLAAMLFLAYLLTMALTLVLWSAPTAGDRTRLSALRSTRGLRAAARRHRSPTPVPSEISRAA